MTLPDPMTPPLQQTGAKAIGPGLSYGSPGPSVCLDSGTGIRVGMNSTTFMMFVIFALVLLAVAVLLAPLFSI